MAENKKKILIVDDEPDFLELCSIRLRKTGYDVSVAKNGEEAVGALKAVMPDLLLLDLRLPEMQGEDLCKFVKNDTDLKNVRIILFTAARCDLRDKMAECGADDSIAKPFDSSDLIGKIRKLIG